jgi:hypothetical protein
MLGLCNGILRNFAFDKSPASVRHLSRGRPRRPIAAHHASAHSRHTRLVPRRNISFLYVGSAVVSHGSRVAGYALCIAPIPQQIRVKVAHRSAKSMQLETISSN